MKLEQKTSFFILKNSIQKLKAKQQNRKSNVNLTQWRSYYITNEAPILASCENRVL